MKIKLHRFVLTTHPHITVWECIDCNIIYWSHTFPYKDPNQLSLEEQGLIVPSCEEEIMRKALE